MNSVFSKHARMNAVVVAAVILLTACGGGSGQLAGISGTGITSSGTVTGFGSVVVNGVEFDTGGAKIIVDGERATQAALRVGQIVTVTGVLETETSSVAETVVFNRLLDGPIAAKDSGNRLVTALGQSVLIDDATRFDGVRFVDLAEQNLILVSGFTDENGNIVATYIRRGAVVFDFNTRIDVEDALSNLNMLAQTFDVGLLPVNYAGADVDETAGALREGATVEIFGMLSAQTGIFTADTVTVIDPILAAPGGRVELEGIIANFAGRGDFTIGGQPIDASAAVQEVDTGLSLGVGVTLDVEGEIADDGVLVAESVAIRPSSDIRIEAAVDAGTSAQRELKVFGLRFGITPASRFHDQRATASGARGQGLQSLRFSDYVAIDAYRDARGDLVAGAITRAEFETGALVRGPASAAGCDPATNTVTVAGVPVRFETAALTAAGGEHLRIAAFCSLVKAGGFLEARGAENGNELIAEIISLIK